MREGLKMTILSWIILGAVAGMLASQIVGAEEKGCVVNIVLGIGGAVVGGWIFGRGVTSIWDPISWGVAIVGAVIVIAAVRLISGGR